MAALTGTVVVLLSFAGVSPGLAVSDRVLNTALGCGMALLAYVAWPTWERGGLVSLPRRRRPLRTRHGPFSEARGHDPSGHNAAGLEPFGATAARALCGCPSAANSDEEP